MCRIPILILVGAGLMSVTLPVGADDEAVPPSATTEAPESDNEPKVDQPSQDTPATPAENGDSEQPESDESPEATVSEDEFLQDPFSYLQSDMQSAVVDLKDGETQPPAKVTQPRILQHFDLLIKQLEEQAGGAGAAGQRVNRPAQQSSLMRGPGGQNEMRAPRDDGRDWADLSPKERQKILQSKTDGFPAGYDEILADYFRRVARAQDAQSNATADGDAPVDASDAVDTSNEGSN